MPVIHRDTDYALRALAQLARTGEVMSVSALAEAEHVPQDFLRKIMQKLQGAHLVQSTQGPLGGYSLRRMLRGPRHLPKRQGMCLSALAGVLAGRVQLVAQRDHVVGRASDCTRR